MEIQFKRDSEAKVVIKDGYLVIEQFYPLNLLRKLSEQKEDVAEWRELVASIMVDWNDDGAVLGRNSIPKIFPGFTTKTHAGRETRCGYDTGHQWLRVR